MSKYILKIFKEINGFFDASLRPEHFQPKDFKIKSFLEEFFP